MEETKKRIVWINIDVDKAKEASKAIEKIASVKIVVYASVSVFWNDLIQHKIKGGISVIMVSIIETGDATGAELEALGTLGTLGQLRSLIPVLLLPDGQGSENVMNAVIKNGMNFTVVKHNSSVKDIAEHIIHS